MKTSITLLIIGVMLYAAILLFVPIIDRAQQRNAERYGTFVFTADNQTFERIRR